MSVSKQEIRQKIWKLLEEKDIAIFPRPVFNRIPNFRGSDIASVKLSQLEVFKKSNVIKINPDSPQRKAREITLSLGKTLIMPTPRIKEGFLLLDPKRIPKNAYKEASTIKGAFEYGVKIHPKDLPSIDFIVLGSVAVSLDGARIGKGEGYGELEFAILLEYGKIKKDVKIATTVHDLQIVEEIPVEPFDVSVDLIVTPRKVFELKQRHDRPHGIIWELLPMEKIEEIPILKELYLEKQNKPIVSF